MSSLHELVARMTIDPARQALGFEAVLERAQDDLLRATNDVDRARILGDWLGNYQPCMFGKVAARKGQLALCFVTDEHISQGDEAVHAHIHREKLRWRRQAARGLQSGFVVIAVSAAIAYASPDEVLQEFAQRLAALYLNRDGAPLDEVLLDYAVLEVPGREGPHLVRWDAGVNVFAAAGDRRWWQDHRIPAGLAFSMNSVGHMVKSAQLTDAFHSFVETLNLIAPDDEQGKIGSLEDALSVAMLTIDNASDAVSGKATWLVSPQEVSASCPKTTAAIRKKVADKSYCLYRGMYHTDHTIPTSYFRVDVERPRDTRAFDLDFTYLYHDSVTNPAYRTMGAGEQIRGEGRKGQGARPINKARRQWGSSVRPDEVPEVMDALRAADD